jgi:DNA topoisomerase-1
VSKNLLIVESPSKAKTLKKYLGPDFEILASYGHVRDLVPKSGAVNPAEHFAMKYQLVERNEKHVEAIAKAVKSAENIFLATDPDREGEAIAWHLEEILNARKLLKNKHLQRVVFYEITQNAVREAVAHPRDISMPLVNAQQARRALDYLVGFNLSPLLWKKIRRGLSAGRVQSPALRLIVERENEISAFRSEEYWSIHLDSHKDSQAFSARLVQFEGKKLQTLSIGSESRQSEILKALDGKTAKVLRIEKKRKKRHPAPPFTTSTLQQESVRKLGFTTDRTMKIAQQLYEGVDIGGGAVGLISYMRTDSVNLSQEALGDIRKHIEQNFSGEYLPSKPVFYANKSKNAQEAHEAIRPTSISRTPANLRGHLTADQFRLYEMIWKRTVASQMTQAQFDTVSVDIAVGGPENLFRATGQTLIFPGFIAVYREDVDDVADGSSASDDNEARLPQLTENELLPVDRLWGEQHFTQPPPRYSEASLVKALEEYGIGRPSTYANIISTLLNREYVVLDKKRFIPTDVGTVVNKFLTEHFTRYVDYDFTAKLEDQLDVISEGKTDWIPVLEQFWDGFSKQVEEKAAVSRAEVTQEALDETCPKCGKPLVIRLGRRGKFVGCSGYPECDFTRNLDGGAESTEPVVIGAHPESGLPILLLNGPYGPYLQLGETSPDSKKPKRVSLPKNLTPAQVTPDIALRLLSLPRDLGTHPETGKKVTVNIGRFGPYIQHEGGFRSIPKTDNVFDIELDRAVQILSEPKGAGRGALKQLGVHPQDQQPVAIYGGRYGPYVKHGKVNATLPAGVEPDTITLEEALELLSVKATKKKAPARKKTAAAKTTKKKVSKKAA